MHVVQFLLPLRDAKHKFFGHERFEQVRRELTERFGGVTAFLQAPASGLWKSGSGTERDELVLFEVMTDSLDRAFWGSYRAELERRFEQEKVLMRSIAADVL